MVQLAGGIVVSFVGEHVDALSHIEIFSLHHCWLLHAAHRSYWSSLAILVKCPNPVDNMVVNSSLLILFSLDFNLRLIVDLDEFVRHRHLRGLTHVVHLSTQTDQAVHHMA